MNRTTHRDKATLHEPTSRGLATLYGGAMIIGGAWLMPLSSLGTFSNMLGFLLLLYGFGQLSPDNYRSRIIHVWGAGCLAIAIGFYWIFFTIQTFGQFSLLPALILFLLFVVISSLQFPLSALVLSVLPAPLRKTPLAAPLVWVTLEISSIRIFPWSAAHPLIATPAFAQLAEIGGVSLVSLIFLLIVQLLVSGAQQRSRMFFFLALTMTVLIDVWGNQRIETIKLIASNATPISVGLVQGNIPIDLKHDRAQIYENVRRYVSYSRELDRAGQLIVWPESVLIDWVREDVAHRDNDRRIPRLENGASLIFGALSFRSKDELFNSAFAVHPDGSIPAPYHKRILMPFGEFTPFAGLIPYLRTLNNNAGDFTAGHGAPLLEVTVGNNESARNFAVTPLICYEDVVSSISALGTKAGSKLLVNLTNDAWFGETVAPQQHHQIASFRAIENRRSLIRSTNTGLSGIVAPWGETTFSLSPFSVNAASSSVWLMDETTPFTHYEIEFWWDILSLLVLLTSIETMVLRRIRRTDVL